MRFLRRCSVALLGALALVGVNGAAGAAASGAPKAWHEQRIGTAPALPPQHGFRDSATTSSTDLHLDVILQPEDPAALSAYVAAVSDPMSPDYQQYLSPGQFASTFGPSSSTLSSVEQALGGLGLRVGQVASDGLSISVSGSAATIESAFDTPIEDVLGADGEAAYSNTTAPALPSTIAGAISTVVGLSTAYSPEAVPPDPAASPAQPASVTPDTSGPSACASATNASGQNGPYTAAPLASDYGFSSMYGSGDLGSGATIALYELEVEPNLSADITGFKTCYGLTDNISTVEVDGGAIDDSQEPGIETDLDIDVAAELAPAASVEIYQGPNADGPSSATGPYDTWAAIVNQDNAQVISSSWGTCDYPAGYSEAIAENELFAEAAVQGQTIVAAAGDSGSACGSSLLTGDPAAQPYVTGVGGTNLTQSNESVWNNGAGEGGGGGISSAWTMPTFQSGAAASLHVVNSDSSGSACGAASGSYCREVPDVSADADPNTGYVIFSYGSWFSVGGTSGATPLWGALFAVVDADSNCGGKRLGWANPDLYSIAGTPSTYASDFRDITSGNNDATNAHGGLYPATSGYDMASGLGTPKLPGLATSLCSIVTNSTPLPSVTSLSVSSGTTLGGSQVTITGTNLSGATAVSFGATPASSVNVESSTEITATSPAHAAGSEGAAAPVDVTVTTPGGTSPAASGDLFTYYPPSSVVGYPSSVNAGSITTVILELVSFGSGGVASYESGRTVSLSATAGSPTISPASAVTNSSGQASFQVSDANAETVTIQGNDLTDHTTVPTGSVTFFAAAASPSLSTVTPYPGSLSIGSSSNVAVVLEDSNGDPLGGKTVSMRALSGSPTISSLVATNPQGNAEFNVSDSIDQTVILQATDTTDNVTVTQTAAVTFTSSGASASTSTLAANPSSLSTGSTSDVIVTLDTSGGSPLNNKAVTLSATAGSPSISPPASTTNAAGQALFYVSDSHAEADTLQVRDTTDNVTVTQTAAVTFTSSGASASTSTLAANPSSLSTGSTSDVIVTLDTSGGSPLNNKAVTLSATAGSPSISPPASTTNAAGQALFYVSDSHAEADTLQVRDTTDNVTVTQTAAVTFTSSGASASTSTLAANPSSLSTGSTSDVIVTLDTSGGSPLNNKAVTLSATAGSPSISPPASTTNAAGQALFYVSDSHAEADTLQVRDTTDNVTVTQTAAVTFTSSGASASTSTLAANPSSLSTGSTSDVIVTLDTSGGSPLNNKAVTLSATAGSPSISPPASTTNAAGQALFYVSDSHAEADTLQVRDTTDNVTVTQTAAVTFTSSGASASTSTLAANPSSLSTGSTSDVIVTLDTSGGSPLNNKAVTLSATAGSPSISPPASTTNAAGQALFYVSDSHAEADTLQVRDTTDNVTVTQTAAVTFTSSGASASTSTLAANPSSLSTGSTSDVIVTLDTSGGSPLNNKAVTLSATAGSPSISPPASTTNAAGQALFYVSDSHAEADTLQVRDTTDNVTVTQTAAVTFTSSGASASTSTLAANPSSLSTGSTSDVIVTLDTSGGSPLNNKAVTLSATAGSPSISPPASTTNAAGQALFYVSDSHAEADTLQVRDTTDNVTVTQTAAVTFTSPPTPSSLTSGIAWYPANPNIGATADVIVTFETAGGAPLNNRTVALSASAGSPKITPAVSTTNATGQVLFYVSDSRSENVALRAIDETDGNFTITQSGTTPFVTAAVAKSHPTCSRIAPSTVSASLGGTLKALSSNTSSSGATCLFSGAHVVRVEVSAHESEATFRSAVEDAKGAKPESGVGTSAFVFSTPAKGDQPAELHLGVKSGSVVVVISASGTSVAAERGLAKKLLLTV